jgi:hypothetical protein
MEKTAMKRVARAEVKSHEKKMHGVKKMRAGGKTNADMMKYGRNMAKVMNQRSPMRAPSKKTGI